MLTFNTNPSIPKTQMSREEQILSQYSTHVVSKVIRFVCLFTQVLLYHLEVF